MKPSSKPVSSPGRAEKFPPPLMRFLRSNVGSRSRGRSRSSPMFITRKKHSSSTAAAAETQEPTSPKVTCIGQVRVRRSNKPGRSPTHRRRRRRFRWVRTPLLCSCVAGKLKPAPIRPVWRKWVRFFSRRKRETSEDSFKSEPYRDASDEHHHHEREHEKGLDFEGGKEQEYRVSISSACSPPKNALLLTRCRSAPYRSSSSSSSLTSRFWGDEEKWDENRVPNIGTPDPASDSDPTCRDSAAESRTDPEVEEEEGSVKNSKVLKESEGSTEHGNPKPCVIEEWETEEGAPVVRPLILTRCKSAPARRFGKVGPL